MLRYYVWAFGERALSLVPGGESFYRAVGRLGKRTTQGTGTSFVSSLPVTKKVQELAPPGATIMDFGTGWFHHDAFLVYLAGDYRVILFDIRDKATLTYIRNYLNNLLGHSRLLAAELGQEESAVRRRLQDLIELPSREAIYERANFTLCTTQETSRPFLPENSLDFVISNCALVHIPPEILLPELRALHAMLKDTGYMYHHLGHDDHWAFHDPAVSWPSFNYMRYSDRVWGRLFQSFEYHNRMVKPEWIETFRRCGFAVEEYNAYITDESRDAVRRLPKLGERFARYDVEDLAIIYSYVLLRKGGTERSTDGTITGNRVVLPAIEPS